MSLMSAPRSYASVCKRLLLAFGLLLIVLVSMIGYNLYQMVDVKIPESYAAWTTGNLMVEYLMTHTNQWPRSWDDLRSATNSLQEKGMPVYMPLGQLERRVKIDWQADTGRLLQASRTGTNITINVITRFDGSKLFAVWGSDTEPNGKIMRYLKTTLEKSKTTPQPPASPH